MGKGTHFQDVSPSFNYKCSWLWHSCNWGADLFQIISTDVRGWSPRGGGKQRQQLPPPSPELGRHMSAAFLRSLQGPGWKRHRRARSGDRVPALHLLAL